MPIYNFARAVQNEIPKSNEPNLYDKCFVGNLVIEGIHQAFALLCIKGNDFLMMPKT